MDISGSTWESNIDGLHGEPSTGVVHPPQTKKTGDNGDSLLEEPGKGRPPKAVEGRARNNLQKVGSSRPKPKRSVSWAHVTTLGDDDHTEPEHSSVASGSDLDAVLRHYGLDNKIENNESPGLVMPTRRYNGTSSTEHSHRLAAFGLSLSTAVSDVILVYPCLVLRRQCQVSNMGRRYHIMPFTIIGVAVNLQRSQGITCLWNGVGSHLMIRVLSFGVEYGLSEMSAKLPREIDRHSSLKDFIGHIILKVLSTAVLLPFYSAHLVESIQSEKASDTPGLFFFITEGFSRLLGLAGVQSPRMLPFRRLLIPTVLYFLLKYILSSTLQYVILSALRFRERKKHVLALRNSHPLSPTETTYMSVPDAWGQPVTPPTQVFTYSPVIMQQHELLSTFISQLITDILLYPYETIMYRLHVQGTRTIIDDMDRGSGFLPVSSRYEGFFDCLSTARNYEGGGGLYRGFGALILQYTMKFSVVKLALFVLTLSSGSI